MNAHDGVNGHPVKLYVQDDGGDPATALKGVKTLIQQDKVVAIVGDDSLVDANWADYAASRGVPVIGGISFESPFLSNPDFYPSGSSIPVMLVGQLQQLKNAGKKSFGVLYCSESPVCAQLGQLGQGAAALVGGVSVHSGEVSASSPNYTSQCQAMKNDGVDALEVGSNSTVVVRVTDDCAQQGYTPLTVNEGPTAASDWLTDANLNGALITSPNANYTDTSIPAVQQFLSAVDTYVPGLRQSPQFSYDSIFPWVGGQLFAAAATAANLGPTSTSADVKKGLYSLHDETLGGLAPPLSFTQGQPAFPSCYFVMGVQNGKFTSPDGTGPSCLTAQQFTALGAMLKG